VRDRVTATRARVITLRVCRSNDAILDRVVNALGKKWFVANVVDRLTRHTHRHPEHFICQQCLKGFPTGQFFEKEGKPYCEACFGAVHAPRCGACDAPIQGDCVNALGNQVCVVCCACV
jgi:paxillin